MTGVLNGEVLGCVSRNPKTPEGIAATGAYVGIQHSQNSLELHGIFASQMVVCHSEWKPEDIDLQTMAAILQANVDHYFAKGHHVVQPSGVISKRVADTCSDFLGLLRRRAEGEEIVVDPARAAKMIVERDEYYLIKRGGRPDHAERKGQDPNDSRRWRSFVVRYGLEGTSTGAPELEDLYRAVSSIVLRGMTEEPDSPLAESTRKLIKIHADAHPNERDKLLRLIPYELEDWNFSGNLAGIAA